MADDKAEVATNTPEYGCITDLAEQQAATAKPAAKTAAKPTPETDAADAADKE